MRIRELVQTTLDNALYNDGVRVFWRRKTQTDGEEPDEYIVYTLDSDTMETAADDAPLVRSANIVIRYYYRDTLLDTNAGRNRISNREHQISDALHSAGGLLPNGYFDSGDIENIGFGTTIFECELWRVV